MILQYKIFKIAIIGLFAIFIATLGSYIRAENSKNLAISFRYLANLNENKAARGLIFDLNTNILAKNLEMYNLYIKFSPNIDLDEINNISQRLKDKIRIDYIPNDEIEEQKDILLSSYLTNHDLILIKDILEEYSDTLYYKKISIREYTNPYEFSHIIGYTGLVTEEDLAKGYTSDDTLGKYKLEKQYEDILKGTKGRVINVGGVEIEEPSEPGYNIYLTIDSTWQRSLYKILGRESDNLYAAGAAGVVVDNSNGNIIAMVSYPGIDTNQFVRGIGINDYNQLLEDRRRPLQDKAIGNAAAPGSTFKIITAVDLLENGIVDGNTTFFSNRCMGLGGGYDFCEFGKLFYGEMNVVRGLYKSSNLFFCNFLLRQDSKGEIDKFVNLAKLFNIGEKTGINLEGEIAGNMDSPEYREDYLGLKWFVGDTCNAAIGQGAILVTPIQMAMVASTIANGGVYYKPNIIQKITDNYGNTIEESTPQVLKNIPIQQTTLDLINQGMSQVAYNPEGTVYYYLHDVPGNLRVKTGTAEAYENIEGQQIYRTHGWIMGTFEYNNKSYSFAFHLSYGGGGFYIAKATQDFVNCVYSNFSGDCL